MKFSNGRYWGSINRSLGSTGNKGREKAKKRKWKDEQFSPAWFRRKERRKVKSTGGASKTFPSQLRRKLVSKEDNSVKDNFNLQ